LSNLPNNNPIPKKIIAPVIPLLIAIFAVSTASLFIRNAQNEVPSLVIAAYRLLLAAIFTGLFVRLKDYKEIFSLGKKQWILIIFSGLFLALHFAAWISSLEITSVTSSVVLVTTTPIWVALLSPLFLKEKINWKVGIGLVIALSGGVVVIFSKSCSISNAILTCSMINNGSNSQNLLGNTLALMGAFAAAGYTMIGRKIRPTMSLIPYTFLVYAIAAIILIIFSCLAGFHFSGYTAQSYLWLILLALVPQIIGHTTLNWALGFLPASSVAIALLGEPVGSTILAWLFLKESPTFFEIVGGILILGGIVLATKLQNDDSN
jgi:drug/metabolite transporter (DMT)-like permease